jgi:hypothetical protein
MFDIISSIADELKYLRSRVSGGGQTSIPNDANIEKEIIELNSDNDDNIKKIIQKQFSNNLISVSDNEDDDYEDVDGDDDDDDDDEIDDDDDEIDENINLKNNSESDDNIKIINISDTLHYDSEVAEPKMVFDTIKEESIDIVTNVEENVNMDNTNAHLPEDDDDDTLKETGVDSLKSIHILGLEESESVDYKKMSLHKLRSLVVEKNLTSDSSKLKKPEIFKLLGIE